MAKPTKFWDKIAEKYSRQPIADEAAYQKKLQVTRGYFRPEMEVVEFGSGTGSTAIVHAPHVRRIRAVDISHKMTEIARAKAEDAGVANITFEQSTIEEFNVADESVDAVLMLSLLHLLKDEKAAIAKAYRMLKPGGIFVSSTTCLGESARHYKFLKLAVPIGKLFGLLPSVLNFFSLEELEDALTTANFHIDHQWYPGKGKAVFIVAKKPG